MEDLQNSLSLFLQQRCVNRGGENDGSLIPPWDVVEQAVSISAKEALLHIKTSFENSNDHSFLFFTTYSWEIMDLLYSLTLTNESTSFDPDEESSTDYMVQNLVKHVRLKELEIMVMERAHMSIESYKMWRWLIFTFQCLVVKSLHRSQTQTSGASQVKNDQQEKNVISAIEQTLLLLLAKAEHFIGILKSKSMDTREKDGNSMDIEEDHSEQDSPSMTSFIKNVVEDLVLFSVAILNRSLKRLPLKYLEGGLFIKDNAVDDIYRRLLVTDINLRESHISLVAKAFIGTIIKTEGSIVFIENLFSLLRYSASQSLNRETKSLVLMWEERERAQNGINHRLLSKDNLALERSMSVEDKLIRDAAWHCARTTSLDNNFSIVTTSQLCSPSGLSLSLSPHYSPSSEIIANHGKEINNSDNHRSPLQLLSFTDGHVMGCALLVHFVATTMITASSQSENDTQRDLKHRITDIIPHIYSKDFYIGCLQLALPYLIAYTEVSSVEGLKTLALLYPSNGRVDDLKSYMCTTSNVGRCFIPQWARLKQNQVLDDHVRISYGVEGFSLVELNAASLACAHSVDIWHYTQCIISALAICKDTVLSSKAYHSFKCFLTEKLAFPSLFVLLAELIDHCPYKQMIAILVDIVKALLQLSLTSGSLCFPKTNNDPSKPPNIAWVKISSKLEDLRFRGTREGLVEQLRDAVNNGDIVQVCNRVENVDNINAHALLSDGRVFCSPLVIKRFGLVPLVKIWKKLNGQATLETEDIDHLSATVNLISIAISKLKIESNSFYGETRNSDYTTVVRDAFDMLVLIGHMRRKIQEGLSTPSAQIVESLRIEMLIMNFHTLIGKVEDMIVSWVVT